MRYWKLEEIQRMLNAVEGYENVIIEFQCQQADGWNKLNWDCKYGVKEQLVNGQWNWLLKHTFVVEAKTELDAHNLAWQEAAERLVTDVWRTSINSFRNEQKQRMADKSQSELNKELVDKLSIYRKPLPRKVMEEILKNSNESTYEYAQPLSTDTWTPPYSKMFHRLSDEDLNAPLTEEITNIKNMTNMTDNGTKLSMNTQTNTDTPNMNATDENIPTWKKLCKSFMYMMITFMFVYAGFSVLTWLYDTLGMEHIMPTLIGIVLWIAVYDHMYGTASKAPRIK